jgi:hypothetical protein
MEEQHVVLMIQVENEVGMLPVARDHSPEANRLFQERVPRELVRRLTSGTDAESDLHRLWKGQGASSEGSWAALFGEGAAA